MVSRRDLFARGAALGLNAALPNLGNAANKSHHFRFVHFTDLHIQSELGATTGVAQAVQKVLSLSPRPDFVLTGGDHVMDALQVPGARAVSEFELVNEALKPLEMPVYSAIGNHDVFGWSVMSPITATDPEYGKKLFQDKFLRAPLYQSFDYKGWHFVILDCIQTKGKNWRLAVDQAQIEWLEADLTAADSRPTIVMLHAPVLTTFVQFTQAATARTPDTLIAANGQHLHKIFAKHRVKAVLQGHTHVVEEVKYLDTKYITGGSVCGEWWRGQRLGVHPEGFAVYDIADDKLHWTYVSYGWKARV